MSFKARCNIDGYDFNVLECHYTFSQQTDHHGKPVARPTGGVIELLVESAADTSLFDWMIADAVSHNGSIIFYRRDAISRLKELRFADAYCIRYTEYFNAENEQPMHIRFRMSARKLTLNGSTFEHRWTLK
ncbi:hypothetical protein CLV59_109300 [Chitinophaga dinghuensis]|uniref:Phage tail protein n=1 Tax=Chitinophaga dinghuensis TaxID=1539050 RepID=A0A327VPI4_9BACT|nr:type VI secretion system tube protein TssD [Chitinophaga dinghuensis]RAJ75686.1 hypothetical protein CLV59_109300 [Chitinophaga dinghuensis]